jgi:hypothetical protein
VKQLEESQKSLHGEITELRMLLRKALLENRQLRHMMEEEQQVALERNRALKCLLDHHIHQPQGHHRGLTGTTLPDLVRPARSASNPAYDSLRLSGLLLEQHGHGVMHCNPIQGCLSSNKLEQLAKVASDPFYESPLTSRSINTSGRGLIRREPIHADLSSNEDRIRIQLEIKSMQEALDALKESIGH